MMTSDREDLYVRQRRRPLPHAAENCKGHWEISVKPFSLSDSEVGEYLDLQMLCRTCGCYHLVQAFTQYEYGRTGYRPSDNGRPPAPPTEHQARLRSRRGSIGDIPEGFSPIKAAGLLLTPTELMPNQLMVDEPFEYEATRDGEIVGVIVRTMSPRKAERWTYRAMGGSWVQESPHKTPRAAAAALAAGLATAD